MSSVLHNANNAHTVYYVKIGTIYFNGFTWRYNQIPNFGVWNSTRSGLHAARLVPNIQVYFYYISLKVFHENFRYVASIWSTGSLLGAAED